MDCKFCHSGGHEIAECLIYKAKEAREKIDQDGFCFTCRVESDIPHLPEDEGCENNEKCYSWYSTEHHALFCRERIRGLRGMFIPKIDSILLPRFLDIVELDEKYLIGLSSSAAKKIVPLKPIKIMSAFKRKRIEKCTGAEVIFLNNSLTLEEFNREREYRGERRFYRNFYEKIGTKTLFGSPRIIKFLESSLPAENFLQFLSSQTKEIRMSNGKFTPSLDFSDIIRKAPNLEIFTVYNWHNGVSNVRYEKTWLADLLEYKSGHKMMHVAVQPDSIELDIESLVKFVTTKCTKEVKINIQFNVEDRLLNKHEKLSGIWKKVEKYFERDEKSGSSGMQIGFYGSHIERKYSLKTLKSKKQSKVQSRIPAKRKHVETP